MSKPRASLKACLVAPLPPLPSGVSLYTVGLLAGFARKKPPCELVVITNKSAMNIENAKGIRLMKAWTRGFGYFFQVLFSIIKEKPDVVHLQHEFFLFGGMFTAAMFPFLLLSLRLLGIRTVVTIHGVIPKDAANKQFAEAFFVPKNYFLLRVGLGSITNMICRFANTIIVHSSSAREALLRDYRIPSSKIRVVHHGIGFLETSTPHDMLENNVLFFGNITPSKGLEPLISAFELVKTPNSKLIIAGGAHPRGQEYFQKKRDI